MKGFAFPRKVTGDLVEQRAALARNLRELDVWLNTYAIRFDEDGATVDLTGATTVVAEPTADSEAATKKYVDDNIGGHTEDHAARHADGGADEIDVIDLAAAGAANFIPERDGAGGLQWIATPSGGGASDHGALTGLGDNDHPQYLLAADLTKAAIDALNVDADTLDGVDSTGFATSGHSHSAPTHASTTGKTANDHHNENHASRHSSGGADVVSVHDLASVMASYVGPSTALTIDNTEQVILWNGTTVVQDTGLSRASGVITITTAGLYEVIAVANVVPVDSLAGTRGGVRMDVELDPNTGTYANVLPYARGYIRESTVALGANLVFHRLVNVSAANSKLRVRITDEATTEPNEEIQANGASLTIRRVR